MSKLQCLAPDLSSTKASESFPGGGGGGGSFTAMGGRWLAMATSVDFKRGLKQFMETNAGHFQGSPHG